MVQLLSGVMESNEMDQDFDPEKAHPDSDSDSDDCDKDSMASGDLEVAESAPLAPPVSSSPVTRSVTNSVSRFPSQSSVPEGSPAPEPSPASQSDSQEVVPSTPSASPVSTVQLFHSIDEIFEALEKDNFPPSCIRCLQRCPTGEVLITFTTASWRDTFLRHSSFIEHKKASYVGDEDRALVFLTIYDAPYELPDQAIIVRLE